MTGNVPMDMVFMAIDDEKDCQAFVQGYTHDSATIPQMKKYADCIDILHPQTLSENDPVHSFVYLPFSSFIRSRSTDLRTQS